MYGVELYSKVRMAVLRDGLSQREAARRFGIDHGTVSKMVGHAALRGADGVIGARLAADRAAFSVLPPTPFDACDKRPGKTPRQAARSAKGRQAVADWLKTLEQSSARLSPDNPMRGYDFKWMWRELGVADLRV